MQTIASAIMDTFQALDAVLEIDGIKMLEKSKAALIKEDGKFSCALLDAAFTIFKLRKLGDCAINVLDKTYKVQQKKVREILRELFGGALQLHSFYTEAVPALLFNITKDEK